MRKPAKGIANSLYVIAALTIGGWVGVVAAQADLARRPSHFQSQPDCRAEEIAVALAEADQLAAEISLAYAEYDLALCQQGSGPCTGEELAVDQAESDLEAAVIALVAAEAALSTCQQQ